MINAEMRYYDYFTFGELDAYGVPKLSNEKQGTIKIAIFTTSQSVQDNINYSNCNYIGLTFNPNIDSSYVIEYGEEKLKVLYVQPKGRLKQVFLVKI